MGPWSAVTNGYRPRCGLHQQRSTLCRGGDQQFKIKVSTGYFRGDRGPTSVRSGLLEPLIVPGNSSIISLCGISITWSPPVYSCAYVYEGVAGTPTYSCALRGQRTTLSVFPKALSIFLSKQGLSLLSGTCLLG